MEVQPETSMRRDGGCQHNGITIIMISRTKPIDVYHFKNSVPDCFTENSNNRCLRILRLCISKTQQYHHVMVQQHIHVLPWAEIAPCFSEAPRKTADYQFHSQSSARTQWFAGMWVSSERAMLKPLSTALHVARWKLGEQPAEPKGSGDLAAATTKLDNRENKDAKKSMGLPLGLRMSEFVALGLSMLFPLRALASDVCIEAVLEAPKLWDLAEHDVSNIFLVLSLISPNHMYWLMPPAAGVDQTHLSPTPWPKSGHCIGWVQLWQYVL